jgi:hypothetical protein
MVCFFDSFCTSPHAQARGIFVFTDLEAVPAPSPMPEQCSLSTWFSVENRLPFVQMFEIPVGNGDDDAVVHDPDASPTPAPTPKQSTLIKRPSVENRVFSVQIFEIRAENPCNAMAAKSSTPFNDLKIVDRLARFLYLMAKILAQFLTQQSAGNQLAQNMRCDALRQKEETY